MKHVDEMTEIEISTFRARKADRREKRARKRLQRRAMLSEDDYAHAKEKAEKQLRRLRAKSDRAQEDLSGHLLAPRLSDRGRPSGRSLP